jgi:hypothetical protein
VAVLKPKLNGAAGLGPMIKPLGSDAVDAARNGGLLFRRTTKRLGPLKPVEPKFVETRRSNPAIDVVLVLTVSKSMYTLLVEGVMFSTPL